MRLKQRLDQIDLGHVVLLNRFARPLGIAVVSFAS